MKERGHGRSCKTSELFTDGTPAQKLPDIKRVDDREAAHKWDRDGQDCVPSAIVGSGESNQSSVRVVPIA
jgi:hypothetical protein